MINYNFEVYANINHINCLDKKNILTITDLILFFLFMP